MSEQTGAQISLKELLVEETVAVGLVADSWQQAVEKVGHLLHSAGFIELAYIEAMKRTINELGPYSVIAPGIALPHARPEDGVRRTGFGLITLEHPVEFGNEANDPVDIVVAFAAVDKETHVQALRQIAAVLGSQKAVAAMRGAKNKQQLLDEIHGQLA